ncbi:DICT sensory domain-containing protein [Halobium salinum]|uniref:DICT sensory domain-containing protein n=1 Tax=Halobium salinum TaxID=1364940 RepID=A0ABD5P9K0_9EURY|nr:DICT sensory domain-containing protein [Halobium salinum]
MSHSALNQFVDEVEAADDDGGGGEGCGPTLVVVNRTEPDPIQRMLDSLFEGQSVSVREAAVADLDDDVVLLLRDDAVVAASTLDALERSVLLVNSDRYITGTGGVGATDPPAVLTALRDTAFRVRGYPASNSEKLPMILLSRYVERLAWEGGSGSLRSAFQRLSRIEDERGTRQVYAQLGATDLDVHVYGVPDCDLPPSVDATVHANDSEEYRRSWFVVYVPEEPDCRHAALVATELAPNEWHGMWTFDRDRVERVDRYVARRL